MRRAEAKNQLFLAVFVVSIFSTCSPFLVHFRLFVPSSAPAVVGRHLSPVRPAAKEERRAPEQSQSSG